MLPPPTKMYVTTWIFTPLNLSITVEAAKKQPLLLLLGSPFFCLYFVEVSNTRQLHCSFMFTEIFFFRVCNLRYGSVSKFLITQTMLNLIVHLFGIMYQYTASWIEHSFWLQSFSCFNDSIKLFHYQYVTISIHDVCRWHIGNTGAHLSPPKNSSTCYCRMQCHCPFLKHELQLTHNTW